MSQQINLLNPALIKQKDLLNPNTIALVLLLMAALMVVYYSYAQKQFKQLSEQNTKVAAELTATQAQLTQMAKARAPREADKALATQIVALEQKQKIQQEILHTVQQSSSSQEKSYAALMAAFARQTVDGLWLTGFSFDSNTEQLNLSGRTLEANLVPEYITRLSREAVLKGKQFSGLNMLQPKTEVAANRTPTPLATATAPLSPDAAAALNRSNAAGTSTTTVKPETRYIEFSLQSIHRDAAKASNQANASGEKS